MKKIIYPILSLLLLTAGCKDEFFDINKNPNSPTVESITPQLILPRALHATGARMATSYDYSAHWLGYWARSGTYGPSAEQESYSITTSYQADEWSGWYDILADVNLMENKAEASGQTFYAGAAKLIKSIGFMYLVDQYNNVPYSKAFDISGNILPAYDKGEDIYKDLLLELDAAAKIFAAVDKTADPSIASADIIFNGDLSKWRKLVNSQRLKLLIRQSQLFGGTPPTAEIAKITADGSGFLMAGESASVQPGYAKIALQQNPFWDSYNKTALDANIDDYNRANNYVLNKMRGSNDERYKFFFAAAETPLGGNTYYGYNFGENVPNSAPKAANSSKVAGPGLAKAVSQPQWVFTSVESMFLQAEAIQRGWLTGDAKTAAESAIRESFNWLAVTSGPDGSVNATNTADAYMAQGLPLTTYSEAPDKMKFIVMQKYLALVGVNNFEAWVDYRRVGVPTDLPLSMSTSKASNVIPLRLLYPQAEYTYNADNVAKEGTINVQTAKIFWDKD